MLKIVGIHVFSFAKFQAMLLSLIGLIAGIAYAFGGAIYDLMNSGFNTGSALAFLALIGMPIIFLIIGFMFGFVEALLFNLVARWFGGTKADLFLIANDSE